MAHQASTEMKIFLELTCWQFKYVLGGNVVNVHVSLSNDCNKLYTKAFAYIKHLLNLVPHDKQSSSLSRSLHFPFKLTMTMNASACKHKTQKTSSSTSSLMMRNEQIWTTARWNVSCEWTRRLCGVHWKVRDDTGSSSLQPTILIARWLILSLCNNFCMHINAAGFDNKSTFTIWRRINRVSSLLQKSKKQQQQRATINTNTILFTSQ